MCLPTATCLPRAELTLLTPCPPRTYRVPLVLSQEMAEIETRKFKSLVNSITPQTIQAMAAAGPETQAKLLSGLGLKGYVVTDGSSPINLFNTASGMVGMPGAAGAPAPAAPR